MEVTMPVYDPYQSSTGSYNTSSRRAQDILSPEQAYYEPTALMTGQVWVQSGRQPWPLLRLPVAPPKVIAPILDAPVVAERVARYARQIGSLEAVYVKAKPWGFECWLIANNSNEDERFRLYDLEWQIMGAAPNDGFKFHLVDRQGRSLSEVVGLAPFDAVVPLRRV